jgi:chromosome segregation ATPase
MTKKLTISICKQIAKLSFKIEEMKDEGVYEEIAALEEKITEMERELVHVIEKLDDQRHEALEEGDLTEAGAAKINKSFDAKTEKAKEASDRKIEKIREEIEKAEELQSCLDDTMSTLLTAAEELAGNMDYEFDAYAA